MLDDLCWFITRIANLVSWLSSRLDELQNHQKKMETITSKCRASNCCQNYHQGSILGQDNLLQLNQAHLWRVQGRESKMYPSEKHFGNWSLTRVPNPWDKYVDSKHCWAVFWNRHKYLSVLYPNIYTLQRQVSKIERTRGPKNLWRVKCWKNRVSKITNCCCAWVIGWTHAHPIADLACLVKLGRCNEFNFPL